MSACLRALLLLLPALISCQYDPEVTQSQIESQQIQARDSVGLKYGEHTQTLTFIVEHMSDFVIKTAHNQEVKATLHIYWRQDNVYISPQYREGELIRVLVYEDNYRILLDKSFYITYGFAFQAEANKLYTVRFLSEGSVNKLIALEMSKTMVSTENKATVEHVLDMAPRIAGIAEQLKMLSGVSEFAMVLHQRNSKQMNHGTCLYMSYLMVEAAAVVVIVVVQVRVLVKMLKLESVV